MVPIAENVTVEADSGGPPTTSRWAMLPAILALRAQSRPGMGTGAGSGSVRAGWQPAGLARAFALGAAYVLTGSVNQLAVESGVSDDARALLAHADLADVAMALTADMFEMDVQVQVLRRGTMFGPGLVTAEIYRGPSIEAIPHRCATLERDVLHAGLDEIWTQTRHFWRQRDPSQLARAEQDSKHKMALIFRWYLGSSSRWAVEGDTTRRTDYQLWAGPAVGAFNRWTVSSSSPRLVSAASRRSRSTCWRARPSSPGPIRRARTGPGARRGFHVRPT
jgi:PfaD family protein